MSEKLCWKCAKLPEFRTSASRKEVECIMISPAICVGVWLWKGVIQSRLRRMWTILSKQTGKRNGSVFKYRQQWSHKQDIGCMKGFQRHSVVHVVTNEFMASGMTLRLAHYGHEWDGARATTPNPPLNPVVLSRRLRRRPKVLCRPSFQISLTSTDRPKRLHNGPQWRLYSVVTLLIFEIQTRIVFDHCDRGWDPIVCGIWSRTMTVVYPRDYIYCGIVCINVANVCVAIIDAAERHAPRCDAIKLIDVIVSVNTKLLRWSIIIWFRQNVWHYHDATSEISQRPH